MNGAAPLSAMSKQDQRKRRGRKDLARKTAALSNIRENDQIEVPQPELLRDEGASSPLYDHGDIRTLSTKANVDIRQLERELVAANAKVAALELSHASKVESLSGELEAAKDKISKLEESNASKTSLNVELYRQVQYQRNVSSTLASNLELETWKAKIYKDGTQHAHDYAEAKFEDKITDLEQEASRMISKIEEEADRAVSEAQQKTEVAQSEVEHARKEVEHAKEAIEYAINEAKSAEQAARASKRLADKRGANVFNVAHSNMHLVGFLEDVQEDLKGRKSDLLAENLRLIKSEGRDLVKDMDPELKQKWKAMHP